MNFSNSSMNLSDSFSGYITASEEDCDNTQYLSVLNQDLTLEEMNVTLTNEKNGESDNPESVSIDNTNHPVIFNVDANNQIYSVQVTEDEEGNLQKFQIQYSEDINGELVPMLETIQFLPLEYEEEVITEGNCQTNDNFIMTNERIISEETDNYNMENSLEEEHEWNISPVVCPTFKIPIKTETDQFFNPILNCDTVEDQSPDEPDLVKMKSERICENGDEEKAVEHLEIEQGELNEETIDENGLERERSEEKLVSETDNITSVKTEIYHHQNVNCILKESIDQPKTNVSKKGGQRSLLKDFLNSEQRIVYVRALPEKENIKAVDIESFIKPNSRSLLKCNQPVQIKKTDDANDKNSSGNTKSNFSNNIKTKESKQAKQFMNFINSTTIPQVPERKERLPRKQRIKPVQHQDEDIIVKEMIVSSKGFIEPVSVEQRKHLPVTEYVELLDSGDECEKKKNGGVSKDKLIEISDDTDESDATEATSGSGKKKRGRSAKRKDDPKDGNASQANSPPKVSRLDSEMESVTSTLKVIGMGSEKSAKEKVDAKSKVWKNGFEYKFECEKCKSKFINKFLLNRHQCLAKLGSNNLSCETCKLKFSNVSSLNLHKRSHNKEPLTSRIPKVKVNSGKESTTSKPTKVSYRHSILPPKTSKPSLSLKNARHSTLSTKNKPPTTFKSSLNAKKTNSVSVKDKVQEEPIRSEETVKGLIEVTPEKASKSNVFKCEIQCDKCSKKFENNATWFQHQVLNHGLKTPDRSIGEKKQKKLAKDMITHNGIRAAPTVAKSFSMLRNKVKHI